MVLTEVQLNVLNHVVENGQAWADNAEATMGLAKATDCMVKKVARHEASYDSMVTAGNYKSRSVKEAEAHQVRIGEWSPDIPSAKIKKRKEIKTQGRYKLNETSEYFIEKQETGEPIPTAITTYRTAVKQAIANGITTINDLGSVQEIKDFINTWPDLPEEPEA